MKTKLLSIMILINLALNLSAADVGVIDAGGKYSDIDKVIETIKILGHDAVKLPEVHILSPEKLDGFDCIILAHRSGPLTEMEYKALNDYVNRGGTLLITGVGAFWMKTPGGRRPQIRIVGEGPLKETVGTKIAICQEAAIEKMTVVDDKEPATKKLPETFTMMTTPGYDVKRRSTWRRAGGYTLKATSSTPLIKADTVDTKGNKIESDFLTVKPLGKGKFYRLAICNLTTAIFIKREKHIAQIVYNILNNAE